MKSNSGSEFKEALISNLVELISVEKNSSVNPELFFFVAFFCPKNRNAK
jgi:hypothetical protein